MDFIDNLWSFKPIFSYFSKLKNVVQMDRDWKP